MINELDEVALTVDIPEHGLRRDEEGVVVHVYQQRRLGLEVEFFDPDGRIKAATTLMASQARSL
ncbi:MAG: DUF4926 domain-containing protein [Chroococcidiopsidaceae cyanobacterium CP_BM_ER_R8_30]|nr:DUF4926 domain-containing protein [Chroococcidiopsidaceae cyanobacterium CP_BM_ER_R8_30]